MSPSTRLIFSQLCVSIVATFVRQTYAYEMIPSLHDLRAAQQSSSRVHYRKLEWENDIFSAAQSSITFNQKLYGSKCDNFVWYRHNLTTNILSNKLAKYVIRCICCHAAVQPIVQQEVNSTDSRELHTVDDLTAVIIGYQVDQALLRKEGPQPRPCFVVRREEPDIAVRTFVTRSGVHNTTQWYS
jgi:hypothetical protein